MLFFMRGDGKAFDSLNSKKIVLRLQGGDFVRFCVTFLRNSLFVTVCVVADRDEGEVQPLIEHSS